MRIYNGYNKPLDFCRDCAPTESEAFQRFSAGEGPDNRGNCYAYDAEHPDYEDGPYYCEDCGRVLNEQDNNAYWPIKD
jgi:hypothetical protein